MNSLEIFFFTIFSYPCCSLSPHSFNVYMSLFRLLIVTMGTNIPTVGYIRRSRATALDEHGVPIEVLELHLPGSTYAVRSDELRSALRGSFSARVFHVKRNWHTYLCGTFGICNLSLTKRAMNLTLFDGTRYTVSVRSLKSALSSSRYASVASLSTESVSLNHPPVRTMRHSEAQMAY